jgi:hypothetical protein
VYSIAAQFQRRGARPNNEELSSAQEILLELFRTGGPAGPDMRQTFSSTLRERLVQCAEDPNVVGFKSVVCYRTGLDVSTVPDPAAEVEVLCGAYENFRSRTDVPLRLASKPLNDLVVRTTLEVAAERSKPGILSRFAFSFHPHFSDALPLFQCSFIQALVTRISC